MKTEIYEKLLKADTITRVKSTEFVYVMMNADKKQKAKVYQIVFSAKHNKPIVSEVTYEQILLDIAEGTE